MSLAWFMAMVIQPLSLLVLGVFLMPYTPYFVLQGLSNSLWNIQFQVGGFKVKVIHFLIVLFFGLFIDKALSYWKIAELAEKEWEVELATDYKMKRNRTERDFYLIGMCLFCWIYIWRLCPVVFDYSQMGKLKKTQ